MKTVSESGEFEAQKWDQSGASKLMVCCRKPPVLTELAGEAGSERGSMSRTNSSRDEKEELSTSPRQREIAPPWNLEPTRTFTEQQLELIR